MMTKKIPLLMLGMAAMLASCGQDDALQGTADDGALKAVTITVTPEVGMTTRTAAADPTPTRCYVQVLASDGTALGNDNSAVQAMTAGSDGGYTTTVYLEDGVAYDFLFWADSEATTADAPTDLQAVSYTNGSVVAWAGMLDNTAWSASGISCTLKHVVSRVTLYSTSAFTVSTSYPLTVQVPTTYTAYNVLTSSVSGTSAAYTYSCPVGSYTADDTADRFYVLGSGENQDLTLTYGSNPAVSITNVPLKADAHVTLKGDINASGMTEGTITASITTDWGSESTNSIGIIDLTTGSVTISDDEEYHITTYGASTANTITVTAGSPTIYLEELTISSTSIPISITGGTPTLIVEGEIRVTNTSQIGNGAGIYVASGSSVSIQGSGTDDVLRATGKGYDSAGIGGYSSSSSVYYTSGDITISNVTVYATANMQICHMYPGIGGCGSTCGDITITDAVVYAYGMGDLGETAPAIGCGIDGDGNTSIPTITITNSTIHAYKVIDEGNSYADYIGCGGNSYTSYQGANEIQVGTGGSITSSTVYKYTWDGTSSATSTGSSTYE